MRRTRKKWKPKANWKDYVYNTGRILAWTTFGLVILVAVCAVGGLSKNLPAWFSNNVFYVIIALIILTLAIKTYVDPDR